MAAGGAENSGTFGWLEQMLSDRPAYQQMSVRVLPSLVPLFVGKQAMRRMQLKT